MVVIAPVPAIRRRVRLVKMVATFLSKGLSVDFFGWERIAGESNELRWRDSRVQEYVILHGGGYRTVYTRAMYPIWMLIVFWRVLRLGRSRTILCLGWESAFPATLAAVFTGSRIIFDDADRFSMVLSLSGPVRWWVRVLERWTSKRALVHLVPGWSRYEWRQNNMQVLRNTPLSSDLEDARKASLKREGVDLVVYANGWVGHTRGAGVFLEAMRLLEQSERKVVMHVAGRLDSAEGDTLIRLPNVVFHGAVSQKQALELCRASDVVLTFFDPAVEINKYAESNKWGDCIYCSVPFIVNEEVETAKRFVELGAAWTVPYGDVGSLVETLLSLAKTPELLKEAAEKLERLRPEYLPFDVQLTNILGGKGVFPVDEAEVYGKVCTVLRS